MDQSGDDTCQFLPRGVSRRVQNDVDQSAIDTCHMCHVAVRPTPVGPSSGVVGTHPPTHHPPPTRVFLGSSPGVRKFHGCFLFWEVPGTFGEVSGVVGKSRVYLGSSGCFWEVSWAFWEFPAPGRVFCFAKSKTLNFRNFRNVPFRTRGNAR